MYKITPDSNWVEAVVHSRAGKMSGRFSACFNVISKTGFNRCVSHWQPITQNEPKQKLYYLWMMKWVKKKKDATDNANVKELTNWKNNQVYTELADKN